MSWWKGDGNTVDIVGGNNGTIFSSVAFVPGEVGQAFLFNGGSGAVDVGNPDALHLQNFTIELWFKRSESGRVSDVWHNAPLFAYAWGGYGIGIFDTGELFLTKVGYSYVGTSNLKVTDAEQYHHVAVTEERGGQKRFFSFGTP